MTREEAKNLLPIIQAFAEGEDIQIATTGEWKDVDESWAILFTEPPHCYRIKPKQKYRPFETQEECWNEMLKHQPFGWVKSKKSERLFSIGSVFWDNNFNDVFLTFACNEMLSYCSKSMIKDFTFADGTPFGIKEE